MFYQILCTFSLFAYGLDCRKIDDIEERVTVLENLNAFQTYENAQMKRGINKLKTTVLELVDNITVLHNISNETKKAKLNDNIVDESDISNVYKELDDVVQITKSLLLAFNAEKQERAKLSVEIENLKTTDKRTLNDLETIRGNIEGVQEHLRTHIDNYREEKDLLRREIDKLMAFKESRESLAIEQDVFNNRNRKSQLEIKCDKVVDNMETKYNSIITSIEKLTQSSKSQQISFSARLLHSITNLAPWQTVVFETVITNNGNAYSGQTGIFTAPVSGVYVFYTHILSSDRAMEMCLQRNGGCVLWLYVDGEILGGDSNMIALELNGGDKIKVVKHGHYGRAPFYVHPTWSTFSGYLLYPTLT